MPSLPPGYTVSAAVRDGLRMIIQLGPRCPLCGHGGAGLIPIREVARLTRVSPGTIHRFLAGGVIQSDSLDVLYEWVNARLPEPAAKEVP